MAESMKAPSIALALLIIPLFAAILYTDTASASGQSKTKNAPSAPGIETIPLENRARLFKRVRDYLQAEHDRDWATQYDLMAPEMTGHESKEAFVARRRRDAKNGTLSQLLDFEVRNIRLAPEGREQTWELTGCGIYHEQYSLGSESYTSIINVRLRDNEWFVTGTGAFFQAIDGPPDGCTFNKKRGLIAAK
jgi:hypothetical protein